jgi:peptidoglycan hydrolase CwlO-like protein
MKKIITLFAVGLISSCSKHEPYEHVYESVPTQSSHKIDSGINKMETILQKTESLEENIESIVVEKENLKLENTDLKTEVQEKEKMIKTLSFKIREFEEKVPGKKNLFERILNIKVDSITIIKQDTIN